MMRFHSHVEKIKLISADGIWLYAYKLGLNVDKKRSCLDP